MLEARPEDAGTIKDGPYMALIAAGYFRTLVANEVPAQIAGEMTAAYMTTLIMGRVAPPPKER